MKNINVKFLSPPIFLLNNETDFYHDSDICLVFLLFNLDKVFLFYSAAVEILFRSGKPEDLIDFYKKVLFMFSPYL